MRKILLALAALALLLVILWQPWREKPNSVSNPPPPSNKPVDPPLPNPPAPVLSQQPPTTPVDPPDVPPAERQRVLDAIDNLQFTFRDFANALGGNPVGTNAEITTALLGDNPKQLKLTIPDGSTLNPQGELCDPWGSPWFFHQLSAKHIEIRSAGPDRSMHTSDDFVR